MSRATDDPKANLRKVRDRLSFEAPRARTRPNAPPDLIRRLESAQDLVSRLCLLSGDRAAGSETLEEACEDALVEGHLVLHDWDRWLEREKQQKSAFRSTPPLGQRQHDRLETSVSVKLLRHSVRADGSGGISLSSETTSRPARNVSLGGLFVAVAKDDLPEVGVGNVLHLSVSTSGGGAPSFQARAAVTRRDATGLALRWVDDSERLRQAIQTISTVIRASRSGR